MPELTLNIKSSADLTAFKQAQAAATDLNKKVAGSGSAESDIGKAARTATTGFKGMTQEVDRTGKAVGNLRQALGAAGGAFQMGGATAQLSNTILLVNSLATAYSGLKIKSLGAMSAIKQTGSSQRRISTLGDMLRLSLGVKPRPVVVASMRQALSVGDPYEFDDDAKTIKRNIRLQRARSYLWAKRGGGISAFPTFENLAGNLGNLNTGGGMAPAAGLAVVPLAFLALTKLATSITKFSEEGTSLWAVVSKKWNDFGTKFTNFMSGAGDIIDGMNEQTIQNLRQQAQSGTSNKARNAALLELDLKLIDTTLSDETKAEVRKQIENIKSGKAAETFYKVNVDPLRDKRLEERQIEAGKVMSRNIGMEAMEKNLKEAQNALNAALDANNVALAAEAQVNLVKQQNLMEGAKLNKEAQRLEIETQDNKKILLSRIRQNFDDHAKEQARQKQESDDNKKLLLDRVRRNFDQTKEKAGIGQAGQYSDDMRRVGLIMGGNPSANAAIATNTRQTAINTDRIARQMGLGGLTPSMQGAYSPGSNLFNF